MNKKFKNEIVKTGREIWKARQFCWRVFAQELLSLVFIDYRNWGYVNNIYPIMWQYKEE